MHLIRKIFLLINLSNPVDVYFELMLAKLSERKKRGENISLIKKRIDSFSKIKIPENTPSIDLTQNRICDFNGIPSLPVLQELNLDNNPVTSYSGSHRFPKLLYFSAKGAPISRNPYFKLMSLVAFGNQLKIINGEMISAKIRDQAAKIGDKLLPYLLDGKLISNLYPLRLVDPQSQTIIEAEDPEIAQTLVKTSRIQSPISEKSSKKACRAQEPKPSIALFCEAVNNLDSLPEELIKDVQSGLEALRSKFPANSNNQDQSFQNDSISIPAF